MVQNLSDAGGLEMRTHRQALCLTQADKKNNSSNVGKALTVKRAYN